ncbi:prepilin-type N-terminal cleavage/methylation domain-containing protein [Aquisalimonas sp. 2447]|uniref:PilW family protein n=1 Tax=Aquisalimonas sp. 2447 TaxID=2740807 RepID=UPI00143267ED|nr:PilW family protein [Aquisalimonas sp. 2447]QIT56616.1 prepilin-type N-terminal cleavage/methylation domain-containing protein [Aquisalimonas sp. 2447]
MSGFSLIELMIAMAISLILLLGVTQIYLGTSATNRAQEGLSRVQENARFAIDSLSREIRMAGYNGCPRSKSPELSIMANDADADFIFSGRSVIGVDNAASAGTDFWLNGLPDNLEDEQPAIRVTFSSGSDIATIPDSFGNSAQLQIGSNEVGFRQNDFITITDCETAHIAEITRNPQNDDEDADKINISHGNTGNSPHRWCDEPSEEDCNQNQAFQNYDDGAQAMQFYSYTFYLAENGSGAPSLYRRDDMRSGGEAEVRELVENVEAMRIQYGEDTSGDFQVNRYRTASQLSDNDWQNVLSVRISVLFASDEVLSEARATDFSLLGETIPTDADRRVRQVATTTISLRNRLQ